MLTGKLKYVTLVIMAIVLIIIGIVIYRMFWKFKPSKVKAACQDIADGYSDSQTVYLLLIEGCENILKSAELSKQVEILSEAENTPLEATLATTAMNNLIASKMIEDFSINNPQNPETPVA